MRKNRFLVALSVVLVLATVLASFTLPSFARRKLGDVDGDGKITSTDARLALRASVRLENLSDEEFLAADVDTNTFVTSSDARTILRASVRLESLPDVYVGEEESTTEPEQPSGPDATPTDPEPVTEPEQPSDPETTTEPEQPSDPETTTEPEQPSDPETTTEPEQPVKPVIIPPAEGNEYEILRSGTYYMKGYTVDSSGKGEMEIAKTPDTLYLGSKFENIGIAVLTIGKKAYIVNPAKDLYLELNKDIMKNVLNLDVNEFTDTNSFDFSVFPPLENATRSEEVPGGYVRYVFEAANGSINVTMDGKTLISIENARDGSVYRIDFTSVTSEVPSKRRELAHLKNAVLLTVFAASLLDINK